MQKIIPHLWFNKEAKKAADLYVSLFPNSKIKQTSVIAGTPSGDCDFLSIELSGMEFMLLGAGDDFRMNPSISFLIACKDAAEVDHYWNALSEGGKVLMPLQKYPHSEHYGWTNDRWGMSWQVMMMPPDQKPGAKITPTLMFTQEKAGKAEEAMNFWGGIFKDFKIDHIMRWPGGMGEQEGTVMHEAFTLEGQMFAAMDTKGPHKFTFNEAVSLLISCDDQKEVDHYWEKLSADPKAEQCGWLKDKYGLSWQVNPSIMGKMLSSPDKAAVGRVMEAFMKMKKFNIAEIERAFAGK